MTRAAEMKIRVSVSALRDRVASALFDEQYELAVAEERYDSERLEYAAAAAEALGQAALAALSGQLPEATYGGRMELRVGLPSPDAPDPRRLNNIKADLALLEMATEEHLYISHSDRFAGYLR